ncbi:tRNA 2-thiouridine(34) synthase MnmA [Candidatus Saccharibacteria bacterium]|jgi:tRNA-specific 2-thiouridylase|nr:tRNA 2-thiouridine(34) synthase MnmA [Candidatus Saccharibacteria bacterium]HOR23644.1 tRNA 2-thiouridine(34) synthase MnmA [Candidatus Saccharibacteria bacterium]
MKTIYVGLSGGVDSSVAALLLKEQGYRVVGVYMKNWSQNLPGYECPWRQDYLDAKRIAVQLAIDFKVFAFENEYKSKVVDYMISEYKAGHTPNPDIMCNQEIKFKLFYETAKQDGADMIATGHYAIAKDGELYKGKDINKDQSYFLYRVTSSVLKNTLFPVGEMKKPEVKKIAVNHKLITATKKESMGICFVGKVGIKDFLLQYIKPKKGRIVDQNGKTIGYHDGAIFYTIGQRHGLEVGGGLPYYVVGKNMKNNIVYVTTQLDDNRLWSNEINLSNLHWINKKPQVGQIYDVRVRYRAPLIKGCFNEPSLRQIYLKDPVKSVAPGQSAVIYKGDKVAGGGVII